MPKKRHIINIKQWVSVTTTYTTYSFVITGRLLRCKRSFITNIINKQTFRELVSSDGAYTVEGANIHFTTKACCHQLKRNKLTREQFFRYLWFLIQILTTFELFFQELYLMLYSIYLSSICLPFSLIMILLFRSCYWYSQFVN